MLIPPSCTKNLRRTRKKQPAGQVHPTASSRYLPGSTINAIRLRPQPKVTSPPILESDPASLPYLPCAPVSSMRTTEQHEARQIDRPPRHGTCVPSASPIFLVPGLQKKYSDFTGSSVAINGVQSFSVSGSRSRPQPSLVAFRPVTRNLFSRPRPNRSCSLKFQKTRAHAVRTCQCRIHRYECSTHHHEPGIHKYECRIRTHKRICPAINHMACS